ncbi:MULTISPECIES: helix-turn-helix domain-containing protein [Chryseobacterium]|uniref:helix-turn-helix domain-containing protein n=1 Tax=Chryseobacterium TaxID=59732 RepID=UPI001BE7FB18|nr:MULTISPECIES: helix-turn-helix domain-containing protein [Chryseobacterium]MBT2619877.1 AraC family transcriptional regulator [Chryseobacterium sp. ISL-6]
MPTYKNIASISEAHQLIGLSPPRHPLISVFELSKNVTRGYRSKDIFYTLGFYTIYCKTFRGILNYGKGHYDFDEGSLMFTAPNQAISPDPDINCEEGWGLFFHPDLIHSTNLGKQINTYSFFNYDINEALHVSENEKLDLKDCFLKIEKEYSQNIDKHTQSLIVNNLELLLNYCNRYYDRQFITREKVSKDIVQKFEALLIEYFSVESLIETGLPSVSYFASKLNLSTNYLSDLLSKYTGKSTMEHIHLQLVDRAKTLLWGSDRSISEIAYDLGFEHQSHFTKLFKTKTGVSPKAFRLLN